jgi:dTDP-3-amino-2,3,6-trideoxy-4-keto-D-glucose/dTDP-3-amino-3,4,6-trideoxy-alpha-D-glucose/dTDP-2,6-dideoxy-D-kanosamine transaminase
MTKINFWEYKTEYNFLKKKKLLTKIDQSLSSGEIFFGEIAKNFEKKFLKFNNSKFGLSVKTGTDALIISLLAAGVKPGDEVLTVSLTAIPTSSAIVTIGAKPVYIDVNEKCLIDVNKIEEKITKKTKAIIPVHLYGNVCQMKKILQISRKHKIKVIEDCAQSLGAIYQNKYSGNFGDFSCFSFYPTKVLGAYGDGGFIVCKKKKDLDTLRQLSFYGLEINNKKHKKFKLYYSNIHGLNSRLDNIQATILSSKLIFLKKWINKRRKIAQIHSKAFFDKNKINKNHVFHLYVVKSNLRNELRKFLQSKNIYTGIHYENPTHSMKPYSKYNQNIRNHLINSEKFSKEVVSLPLHPFLKIHQIKKIIREIKNFNKKYNHEFKSTF